MAVYEQTYKRYMGPLTPEWSRFLIIPRHAYRNVYGSKLFIGFNAICFIPLLVEAILIYLHHNANALGVLRVNIVDLLPIDASFFETFVDIQCGLATVIALLIGPPLVSRDLRNNALPLYLCRPFSRTEYVLGKMSVLLILLSGVTWVPQLLLFLFQAYLEGGTWLKDNFWMASAIVIASAVWILLLALISQTISALVKWRVIASGIMIGLILIPSAFGAFVNEVFATRIGNLVSLLALRNNVTAGLFGTFVQSVGRARSDFTGELSQRIINEPPLWSSWAVLFLICAACLGILSLKLKAYEVVK
ncbi:MAG TPA: ABC transporter permease subunit [Pyrinomonadaceae bacterium]